MSEEFDTVDHLPDPVELDAAGVYDWQRVSPQQRRIPSGPLTLELAYDGWRSHGRRRRWADRKRWRLEDILDRVLAEVERRAGLDEAADAAAEQANADQRREWEQAMDAARATWVEDHNVRELNAQIAGWRATQSCSPSTTPRRRGSAFSARSVGLAEQEVHRRRRAETVRLTLGLDV
ncbi:hypothetical protein [Asanoa hainanensis]|uniref:hypothetical protein n=1 Tax=Asanoa hainanensis TaxID=560556 RepID=UPI0015C5C602|nr:hypothetical protein [Asanoa hainanensis]